jgi:hypothetical protein
VLGVVGQMHGYFADLRAILREEGEFGNRQTAALIRTTLRSELSCVPTYLLARAR